MQFPAQFSYFYLLISSTRLHLMPLACRNYRAYKGAWNGAGNEVKATHAMTYKISTLGCWPNHLNSPSLLRTGNTFVVPMLATLWRLIEVQNHEHAFNSLCLGKLGKTHIDVAGIAARILQLIDTIGQPIDPPPFASVSPYHLLLGTACWTI